jgi:hypothetical protein
MQPAAVGRGREQPHEGLEALYRFRRAAQHQA